MRSALIRLSVVSLLGVLFYIAIAAPVQAMLPAPPADEAAAAAQPAGPTQPLEGTRDPAQDAQIELRIGEIFGELPALEAVEVSIDEGVVTLSGTVPSAEDAQRAEAIASRFDVVTIENGIERDGSLGGGLGALGALGERLNDFAGMLPLIGLAILVAVVIGALGYLIAGLTKLWQRLLPNPFLAELVASAIRFTFIVIGLVIALDMVGAGALLGAVLGGAGVIGIALGFAMRDTIENYVASLMLSLRQPFRANDHVLIDDLEGRVIRLTSRATVLMTLEGNHLRIPNGQVFKAVITNFTRNPQRRFEFQLGIDADDDPGAGRRTGREALAALPFVLPEPAPEARIAEVGDSNIVITFLAWVDQRESDWFKARSRAIAAVKDALEDAGFALPEPIYRLRFDERTTPLPFENIGESGRKASVTERPAKPSPAEPRKSTSTEDDDVAPDDQIARMVDAERAAGGEQDKDLLDNGRPVE